MFCIPIILAFGCTTSNLNSRDRGWQLYCYWRCEPVIKTVQKSSPAAAKSPWNLQILQSIMSCLHIGRVRSIDRKASANSPRTYARSKCRTPVRSIELLFLHTRRRRSNGGVQRRGIDRSIDGDLTCPAHRSIDRCTRLAISQVDVRRQFVSNAKLPIKMQLDWSISS